jgi:Domain of unknown function (DUF4129)
MLALLLLSAGLSQIELREGKFLSSESISELRLLLEGFRVYQDFIIGFILIGALIIFVWSLLANKRTIAPSRSKGKLGFFIQIILWVVAIWLLRKQLIQRKLDLTPLDIQSGAETSAGHINQSLPAFANAVPEWFAFLFSLVLILLIGVILWWIYLRKTRPTQTIELLAQEAQNAKETLQAGGDLRNVILRCYYQMAQILYDRRGILRKQAMTPREFERSLVELGLPGEPIEQLTQLFEAVRYGAKDLGNKAEIRAITCLDAIVKAGEGLS